MEQHDSCGTGIGVPWLNHHSQLMTLLLENTTSGYLDEFISLMS
jgi:hypothetical protein